MNRAYVASSVDLYIVHSIDTPLAFFNNHSYYLLLRLMFTYIALLRYTYIQSCYILLVLLL